jgi:glycosyltransferase involved in cell wall biosynthesis
MIRKVLWLGPAFTMAESLASMALAPAASRWQEGFLGGIRAAGGEIDIVANHSERLWPRGPMRVAGLSGNFHGMSRNSVAYVNLPWLREGSLTRRYGQAIDRICTDGGTPEVIASYNTWRPVAEACRRASRKHGIPWIPVLLDHDPPTADWANVMAGVKGSAGVVFLSHWAFLHAPVERKLHLDAGVAHVPPLLSAHTRSRLILYSGALHRWGGIDLLLDAMRHVKTPGARLVVVGRGGSAETMKRLATTPFVEYLGAVDEATLQGLTAQAQVLANPRPSGVGGNEMNFPSKLLHYLSSLKPVATTLTPGVAPEYGDIVLGTHDDSPQAFADSLDRALSLTDDDRLELSARIRAFLAGGRLWSQQGRRFLEWSTNTIRG